MNIFFEWDGNKAATNLKKHGVSFGEAATVFSDPLSLTFEDPDHSLAESRYLTFGTSAKGKMLVVSHSDRGRQVRLISARKMTRNERKSYEEKA